MSDDPKEVLKPELLEEAMKFTKNLKGSAKQYPDAFKFQKKPAFKFASDELEEDNLAGVGQIDPVPEKVNPTTEKPLFRFADDDSEAFWPKKKYNWPIEYVSFVERYFHIHKKLPDRRAFEIQFRGLKDNILPTSLEDWQHLLLSLQEPLQARGLPVYDVPPQYLQPNFVLAVGLVVNVHDKRAIAAKLKEANLTTKQWSNLLRIDANRDYFQGRLNEIFDEDAQADAKVALHRLIVGGDLQAIKHFHELQNIYRPEHNSQQNIMVALQAIMEILARHVSPVILSQVANDIKQSEAFNPKAIESKAS
jgi:hypothetical protein